ncbi:MAG: DUF6078 family protein [Prevotellaceae bacterium]|nr:DUF6078 family protein [Prevotellaceae bacterium]
MKQETNFTLSTKDYLNKAPMYPLCMNEKCPRKTECLRYRLLAVAPHKSYFGPMIMPYMLKNDGSCRCFAPIRKETFYYGFSKLFNNIAYADLRMMKNTVYRFFGGRRNFYRYNSGEYKLNQHQLTALQALFTAHGYSAPLDIDHEVCELAYPEIDEGEEE